MKGGGKIYLNRATHFSVDLLIVAEYLFNDETY